MKLTLSLLAFFLYLEFSLATSFAQEVASDEEKQKISDYRPTANQIIAAGRKQNDSYLKLQELCDDIGHRLSGSKSLEQAIEWAQQSMKADGQENVRAEAVTIRIWVRGQESCELIEPRPMKIDMLGLGWSIGTPPEGITAEVIVVKDKDELFGLLNEAIEQGSAFCTERDIDVDEALVTDDVFTKVARNEIEALHL